jgi:hypothetical protein
MQSLGVVAHVTEERMTLPSFELGFGLQNKGEDEASFEFNVVCDVADFVLFCGPVGGISKNDQYVHVGVRAAFFAPSHAS